MKRTICLLLAAILLLCGCGNGPAGNETTAPTQAPFEATCPPVSDTEPATDEEILQYRRDLVEQQMRYMTTLRWMTPVDVVYSLYGKSKGPESDRLTNPDDIVTLKAGRIYEGIPYTHASGSGYSFISYATEQAEDGTLRMEGFTTSLYNGWGNIPERHGRLGNDCADMLFWAWAHVSTTINFNLTVNMNQHTGCVKVGDYDYEDVENLNTKGACTANGIQRMCEAYALLQKGDGLVHCQSSGGGHAIMNVSAHVVRTETGEIDPLESYIISLEQTSGNERAQDAAYQDEATGQIIYQLEVPDRKYSFYELFSKGYLPFTCKELIDPSPLPESTVTDSVKTPSAENMFAGIIDSPYRISSVTIAITDKSGNTVQKSTMFCLNNEVETMDLARYTDPVEADVLQGLIDLNFLEPGEYTITHTARLSNGDRVEFRSFTYTK